MMHYIKYVTVVVIIILSTGFTTSAASASPKSSDNDLLYFAGGDILYSRRIGSYLFESIEKRQDITKQNLFQFGFAIGKRYYATSWLRWLRFQIEGMFHFGNSVEDTLADIYTDPILYFSSKNLFKHIGINLDLHLVRQIGNLVSPFVICGGGLNYMHLEEETVLPDDHNQAVSTVSYSGKNLKAWSPNFNLGAGFDYRLTRRAGFCIAYSYRIWKPVKYRDASDMPLEAIRYEERFYTHRFQLKFLFGLGGE